MQPGRAQGYEEEKVAEDADELGSSSLKRAVRSKEGSLLAIPLSRDQTPYRKDERERVKRAGAAIMSIDQMEGREEMHENWGDCVSSHDSGTRNDPPRVWVEGNDYPGTVFTRSIGDMIIERIGVVADPEMLARETTYNDEILVIASSSVFEFLTNGDVLEVCSACETPLEACEKIVETAYNHWIECEHRADDISVIVCFLNCSKPPPPPGTEGSTEDLLHLSESSYGIKPVRRKDE
jgi:serine/threonine protein phosphatase PrpC